MRILAGVLIGSSVALAALAALKVRGLRAQSSSWHASLPVFKLKNANGMEVHVSTFGAAILKVVVPDKAGKKADVVLGYASVDEYEVRMRVGNTAARGLERKTRGATGCWGGQYGPEFTPVHNHSHHMSHSHLPALKSFRRHKLPIHLSPNPAPRIPPPH